MIKSITISVEEDNGSTMQHTVSTKEEALALIDRYVGEKTSDEAVNNTENIPYVQHVIAWEEVE